MSPAHLPTATPTASALGRARGCSFAPLLVAEPPREDGYVLPPVGHPAATVPAQRLADLAEHLTEVVAAATAAPTAPPRAAAPEVPAPRTPRDDEPAPPRVPAQQPGPEQRRDPELRRAFGALLRDLTGSEVLTQQAVALLRGIVDRSRPTTEGAPPDADTEADTEAVAALLDDVGRDLAAARERLAEAEAAHAEEQLERALAEQARGEAERRLRDLQRLVQRRGVDLDVWSEPPADRAEDVPSSMAELVARLRLPQLDRVVFTGDAGPALELDELVHTGLHVQRTWEALLALRDYAAAKADGRVDSDLQGYLERTPDGLCTWPAQRHARGESLTVQSDPRLRSSRLLPVPTDVDPSGRVPMWAHLKLLTYGQTSPRLHYYDDTRRSGCVYVGYVGRHLRNTQTS